MGPNWTRITGKHDFTFCIAWCREDVDYLYILKEESCLAYQGCSILLETFYESRVDTWRKLRGEPSHIEGSPLVFCRYLLAKDWPSTCKTYKTCNLKGNWARDSGNATECIVLVSVRSISWIYWRGYNCVKVHMYLLQIYICVCVHIHADTQILKLHGVISHLFRHFHLCIKWSFVCDANVVQHGLRCEMQRAGFTLLIAGCYTRYWLSNRAAWISKAFVCLMCSFSVSSYCMLWRNPAVPPDVHPWHSTAARCTGVTPFLVLVSLSIWSPIGGARCWHFPVWSWSHSPLLSRPKWVSHCIWSQMYLGHTSAFKI